MRSTLTHLSAFARAEMRTANMPLIPPHSSSRNPAHSGVALARVVRGAAAKCCNQSVTSQLDQRTHHRTWCCCSEPREPENAKC